MTWWIQQGHSVKAAEVIMDAGASEVHAYISHGVLSGPAVERIAASVMKSLVITDTIEPNEAVKASQKKDCSNCTGFFAQAILNIWSGTSVSSLFEEGTLGPIYEGHY